MVGLKEAQSINLVHERLAREPELAELRLETFDQLQAYWKSFYRAIYYQHPNYIPLFITMEPEQRKKFGLIDHRQLNDHRVAIVSLDTGEVNESLLVVGYFSAR